MRDHLVLLKPPWVPQFWGTCLDAVAHGGNHASCWGNGSRSWGGPPRPRCLPKTALAPQDRAASLESFIPPRIGGLGGRNHTHNQQRRIFYLFPAPCSLFPVPSSLLPAPCSLFPVP
ncbi:MAG: hypothetical protein F6J99_23465 [Moorea sp. SIO4G3]|nr:hypothetical protein [Moorena sp. SIO4G3]